MDTSNKYMVGVQGGNIVIMNPPRGPISKADALMLAATIVSLADYSDGETEFRAALAALQS